MVGDTASADDAPMDAPPIEPPPLDPTAPGSPDPGPPPAASPPPRRLARRLDERLLGGVAGGVAEYLGVDAVLVRLGFVVTAFFGGLGVIAYGLGWIVLPVAPPAGVAPSRGDRRQLVGYGLVALGLLAIGGRLGWSFRGDGAFWPLVLIGLGAAVVVRAWLGSARGLIALGIPLVLLVGAFGLVDVPLSGGIGDPTYHPRSAVAVDGEYQLAIGNLSVDLRDADFSGTRRHVHA